MNPELLCSSCCSFREDRQKSGIAGWMSTLFRAIKGKERQGTSAKKIGFDELCFQKELIEHKPYLTGWVAEMHFSTLQ